MATTKKKAERPKISSSHSKSGGLRAGSGPKKTAAKTGARAGTAAKTTAKRPSAKKTATTAAKTAGKIKATARRKAAERPSRTAARTAAAAAAQRPKKAATPEVRDEQAEASRKVALAVAKAALDKKASNVQIIDVVGRVDYADFLVLMSGRSDRHVLAVADAIEDELLKHTPKRKPIAVEGRPQGSWVVLDFGEVVAHVFQEDTRSHYDLDSLWQDARRIPVGGEAAPRSGAGLD